MTSLRAMVQGLAPENLIVIAPQKGKFVAMSEHISRFWDENIGLIMKVGREDMQTLQSQRG